MAVTMTVDHFFSASLQPVDSFGNPARVDGVPIWGVSDDNVLEIVPAADGLSADVLAKGTVGTAQVTVSADADLGDGVRELTGILDVDVLAGEAVALNITAGPLQTAS